MFCPQKTRRENFPSSLSLQLRTWGIGGGTPSLQLRTWDIGGGTPSLRAFSSHILYAKTCSWSTDSQKHICKLFVNAQNIRESAKQAPPRLHPRHTFVNVPASTHPLTVAPEPLTFSKRYGCFDVPSLYICWIVALPPLHDFATVEFALE